MGVRAPPLGGGGGIFLVPGSSARGVEGVHWASAPGPVMGPGALVGAGPGVLVPEAANPSGEKSIRSCRGLRDEVMGDGGSRECCCCCRCCVQSGLEVMVCRCCGCRLAMRVMGRCCGGPLVPAAADARQLLPWRWRRLSSQNVGHVVQPQLLPALWWWLSQQQLLLLGSGGPVELL